MASRSDPAPLDLSYLGRLRVVSPEPEVITLLDRTMVVQPRVELTTIFVHDRLLAGPTFPNYPKMCAVNGANIAAGFFGVPPVVGFTARLALFTDGGPASFPALLLDDGRIIGWRTSDQTPEGFVPRPTDQPKRANEMRALIATFEGKLQ
jgi:hypothetical protein